MKISKIKLTREARWHSFFEPWKVGALCCVGLFVAFYFRMFDMFSSLSDSPFKGVDYFTLPRCGLAARYGTDIFTSFKDYPSYGAWSGVWASHPALCFLLGAPLSFLAPMAGYWLMNLIYLFFHLAMVVFFLRKLKPDENRMNGLRNLVFAIFCGLSMPWYTLFNQGNYHALGVIGLFLILAFPNSNPANSTGYLLSAFGKPLLAPLVIVHFIKRRWKLIFVTLFYIILINGVLLLLKGNADGTMFPYTFGYNPNVLQFLQNGSDSTHTAAYRWNQSQSLHSVFQEIGLENFSYAIRAALTVFLFIFCIFLVAVKRERSALCFFTFWYFFLNARGHEYQWTLFTPIMLALYSEDFHYRKWAFVILFGIISIPNGYFLFHLVADFKMPAEMENSRMILTSPIFYILFLTPKPLAPVVILILGVWTETYEVLRLKYKNNTVTYLQPN